MSLLDEVGRRSRFHNEKERNKQTKIGFSNILRKKYKYIYEYCDDNSAFKVVTYKPYSCTIQIPNKIRGSPETVVENLLP